MLTSFEKYYDKLWEELKKLRRMDIEVLEDLVDNPNIYLIDILIEPFTEYIRKKKESKSMLMLQKLNIVFVDDRLILN
jgi:predicted adenine nucleotide alpha hydrolase (AANH) superfamily ATPase